MMLIRAVLSNAQHPEYGTATIPFPIPKEEYDHILELLEPLEIGDPLQRDCKVDEIDSGFSILKRLEKVAVNLDEMDYLAKRLDSFDGCEAALFQAGAVKLGISDMKDLINLTFCCQGMTVITDFGDLEKIGKVHLLTTQGGSCSTEQFYAADGRRIALSLILNNDGYVTPYGVIYDNGVKLEQLYDGAHFPAYAYEPALIGLEVMNPADEGRAFLFLPMPDSQIGRQLQRIGTTAEEAVYEMLEQTLPTEIADIVEHSDYTMAELNDMCYALHSLDGHKLSALKAAMELARPEYPFQITQLIRNLDLFEFIPDVRDAEALGKYMIQESGHYDYDENLSEYYNYSAYGQDRMKRENGFFTENGYLTYRGELSLDELMMEENPNEGFQIGGMA